MKKAIIIFIILLTLGAWSANKYFTRASKSSEELERFQNYARDYGSDANIFLSEQAKRHHDEAFDKAYRMWKLSPVSELDLTSHYDEKTYYMTLGKILNEKAKSEGQMEARNALIDIGKFYGVSPTPKEKPKTSTPLVKKPIKTDATEASPLGKPKLGDKRTIPSSRRRKDDR